MSISSGLHSAIDELWFSALPPGSFLLIISAPKALFEALTSVEWVGLRLDIMRLFILLQITIVVIGNDNGDLPGHMQPIGSHRPPEESIAILSYVPDPLEFYERYVSKHTPVLFKGDTPVIKWSNEGKHMKTVAPWPLNILMQGWHRFTSDSYSLKNGSAINASINYNLTMDSIYFRTTRSLWSMIWPTAEIWGGAYRLEIISASILGTLIVSRYTKSISQIYSIFTLWVEVDGVMVTEAEPGVTF